MWDMNDQHLLRMVDDGWLMTTDPFPGSVRNTSHGQRGGIWTHLWDHNWMCLMMGLLHSGSIMASETPMCWVRWYLHDETDNAMCPSWCTTPITHDGLKKFTKTELSTHRQMDIYRLIDLNYSKIFNYRTYTRLGRVMKLWPMISMNYLLAGFLSHGASPSSHHPLGPQEVDPEEPIEFAVPSAILCILSLKFLISIHTAT